jgi:hypothetical protein
MNFSDLIGEKVFLQTTLSEQEQEKFGGIAAVVEITGVEGGGIWVVHDGMAAGLADLAGTWGIVHRTEGMKVHLFIPFSVIRFAIARSPELDEGSLGIEEPEV